MTGHRRARAALLAMALLLQPALAETGSLLDEAEAALAQGQTQRAEDLYRQLIEAHPNSLQGHRGLATVKIRSGEAMEAASILFFLGNSYSSLALYDEAIEALESALELFPESNELHASLGRTLMLQGEKLSEAERHLAAASQAPGVELTTELYLAAARWELGRFEDAEALYRTILAKTPGSPFVQYQLARLLMATGSQAEALQLLDRAARRQSDDPELLTDLGRALARQGQADRAEEAFRKAIQLDPNRKQAHYGLGRVLLDKGDREASRAEMEIYRNLTIEEHDRVREIELAAIQVGKGWGLLRSGDPEAAIALFVELPESDESLLGLSSAHTLIGDEKAALQALERAVTLYPERGDLQLRLVEARLSRAGGPPP